jgi:hypothetical protein
MPTFDTIKRCAECWSESKLRDRAKLWPDPLTWEWFLGDRCEKYARAECLEFLSVAIAFVCRERVQLPVAPGAIWRARTRIEKTVLLEGLAALGVILDLWELGDRQPPDEELTAALQAMAMLPSSSGDVASSSGGELELERDTEPDPVRIDGDER